MKVSIIKSDSSLLEIESVKRIDFCDDFFRFITISNCCFIFSVTEIYDMVVLF